MEEISGSGTLWSGGDSRISYSQSAEGAVNTFDNILIQNISSLNSQNPADWMMEVQQFLKANQMEWILDEYWTNTAILKD